MDKKYLDLLPLATFDIIDNQLKDFFRGRDKAIFDTLKQKLMCMGFVFRTEIEYFAFLKSRVTAASYFENNQVDYILDLGQKEQLIIFSHEKYPKITWDIGTKKPD